MWTHPGLRLAPKIFNAVADGLEWIMQHRGVAHVAHYLHDFIFLGPSVCKQSLSLALDTCEELGIPAALHKCEGPDTTFTF